MSNEVLTKFVDRLTDTYNKNPESNVYKLMSIAANLIQGNEDTLNRIGDWRDVDQAEGKALDMLGQNVRQNRGQAPDEVYRILIKSKIKRNLSNGSINTLIDFLSFILQVPKTSIKVNELWAVGQPADLKIDVPLDSINGTGLSRKQFGTLVNLVTVAGVNAEVLFEGTFSFSSVYDASQTNATGFADDAGTTGGTLGDSFDPAVDFELPF
jgi:hypothetical protein